MSHRPIITSWIQPNRLNSDSPPEYPIPLLPQARLMAWPGRTNRTAKCHVVKKLPKVHGNYYSSIKIYKDTGIQYKILADNMFRNYFMISYWRHKCFCPISAYFFYQTTMWVFLNESIWVYFLKPSPPWQQWGKQSPYL